MQIAKAVQNIAGCILNRIPDDRRIKKKWSARPEQGYVEYITSIEDIPLDSGDWLILARTNYRLKNLVPPLRTCSDFEIKNRKKGRDV